MNGSNFHAILAARELLETALQTVQAYRMSWLLPRMLFNRFYLILLVLNCWSSVAIYSRLFRWNEVRKRLACLMCDCILDLVSCIGVPLTVVLSYIDDFDPKIQGFPLLIWYDDVWSASVLNEFQMVVVVSWSDLASRTIFSFGLIMTTTSMKKLLRRASSASKRRIVCAANSVRIRDKMNAVGPTQLEFASDLTAIRSGSGCYSKTGLRTQCG